MSDGQRTKRYPGSVPFERAQKDVFFGRESDVQGLYKNIHVNKMAVLHGKSGLGKTSLLNAGLLPLLETDGFLSLPVRFTSHVAQDHTTPRNIFIRKIRESIGREIFLPEVESEEHNLSLWQHFKALEWKHRDKKGIVLVFDQFEEIFTYPEGVEEFGRELAELLNNRMPDFFQRKLYQKISGDAAFLEKNADQIEFIDTPRNLRIILSIRSDRMSLLGRLTPWMPGILKNCYELLPLNLQQAESAIVAPAAKTGNFVSPAFRYDRVSLDRMLAYLSDGGNKPVESFQLQVLCQHIENRVIAQKLAEVKPENLGDIESVYQNFYGSILDRFPDGAEHLAVQRFIEDGLIFEEDERRLSLYEGQIHRHWNVSPETLGQLVDLHLLRAEPSPAGGFSYELCHDSMVSPILKVKKVRREAEQRATETQQRREQEAADRAEKERLVAERERAERRRRVARSYALASGFLALLAIGFGFFAMNQRREAVAQKRIAEQQQELAEKKTQEAQEAQRTAEAERKNAEEQKIKADQNAAIALQKTEEARRNFELANLNLEKARQEEARTKTALQEVQREKTLTEEARQNAVAERQRAEKNYEFAQTKTREAEEQRDVAQKTLNELDKANEEIIESLLRDHRTAIERLNYRDAFRLLVSASKLKKKAPETAAGLLEIAFFNNETGRLQNASEAAQLAANLLKNNDLEESLKNLPPLGRQRLADGDAGKTAENQTKLRNAIRQLDAATFERLEKKYFPEMMPVPAGNFNMGCDPNTDGDCNQDATPTRKISLDAFSLAKTETSFWQWAVFCEANKINTNAYAPGNWAIYGDNPAINISWLDAALYANWLSKRAQLDTAYVFNPDGSLASIRQNTKSFRLPTEAEWEFAARGGPNQPRFAFSGGGSLSEVGYFAGNSDERTRVVATKKANQLGLHDLSGNVQEWCQDWYAPYPKKEQTSPPGPERGDERVLRGGSFADFTNFCSVSCRRHLPPGGGKGENNTGFRVAL